MDELLLPRLPRLQDFSGLGLPRFDCTNFSLILIYLSLIGLVAMLLIN